MQNAQFRFQYEFLNRWVSVVIFFMVREHGHVCRREDEFLFVDGGGAAFIDGIRDRVLKPVGRVCLFNS